MIDKETLERMEILQASSYQRTARKRERTPEQEAQRRRNMASLEKQQKEGGFIGAAAVKELLGSDMQK